MNRHSDIFWLSGQSADLFAASGTLQLVFQPRLEAVSVEDVPIVAVEFRHLVFIFEIGEADDAHILLFALSCAVFVLVVPDPLHGGLSKWHSLDCVAESEVLSVGSTEQYAGQDTNNAGCAAANKD